MSFSIELELQRFPRHVRLRDTKRAIFTVLERHDEKALHRLFQEIPETERMFIKHRVTDLKVIRAWCRKMDVGRNLPLISLMGGKIVGIATLHQQFGGWKRHIGRVNVLVHPLDRGRGSATRLITEILDISRQAGLEKAEAKFIGEQEAAIKMFAMLGFSELLRLADYVEDMQAVTPDYVLMGLELKTDEEYAGVGG